MAKSGFIGAMLIIVFVFLAINMYSVFSSLDQSSTLPWAKRFIYLWFGFGILFVCYVTMAILIIRWFHSLVKYKFITNKEKCTPEQIINFHTSQGLSINTFRNPRFILDITTNVNNNDYRRIPILEAPIDKMSMVPHATYIYLLKPFYEVRQELYTKDKLDIDTTGDGILDPPEFTNTLAYLSTGGLLWALISWGLLLSFSILMTIKLDDDSLTWYVVFIPLYCFLGLPILIWVITILHSSNKVNRYKWYMIGWLFDVEHSRNRGYKRYFFLVLVYICVSVTSIAFLSQYLDDPTPNTDFLYGIFLPQVCFWGSIFCWLLFWIVIPKIIDPTAKERYSLHLVIFLLVTTGLATTFFSLLWVRVQWATFAWSFLLIPFVFLCGIIVFSILYGIFNYMYMDRVIDDYILSSLPFEHMTKDINQSNPSGSEPLLPDITTPSKETL